MDAFKKLERGPLRIQKLTKIVIVTKVSVGDFSTKEERQGIRCGKKMK